MEWIVKNALSRDVEREHLNKILKDIRSELGTVSNGGLSEERVLELIRRNIPSTSSSPLSQSISVVLTGAVEGEGTGTTSVTIPTTLSLPFPDDDGQIKWYKDGAWISPDMSILELNDMSAQGATPGFLVFSEGDNPEETNLITRSLEVVAEDLALTNPDGVGGNPSLSLADVEVVEGGVLQKYGFDSKGRRVEEEAATTDDLDEGEVNLYFTEDRARAASYTVTRPATETISALRVVYEDDVGIGILDPTNDAHVHGLLGIAVTAGSETDEIRVQTSGTVDDLSWSWTPGFVFVGADGVLTQTVPTTGWEIVVGYSPSATRINLTFDEPIKLD